MDVGLNSFKVHNIYVHKHILIVFIYGLYRHADAILG